MQSALLFRMPSHYILSALELSISPSEDSELMTIFSHTLLHTLDSLFCAHPLTFFFVCVCVFSFFCYMLDYICPSGNMRPDTDLDATDHMMDQLGTIQ